MKYAPIAMFVYKRPDHTRQVLTALMQCPEFIHSPLYVFCDAAKKPADQEAIDQTIALVRSMVGEKAEIVKATQNQGAGKSISSGVSQVLNNYDRIIVLEDDLVVSPSFLEYMNMALEAYENEPSVMQISGYMFPIKEFANRTEAMFLPFTVAWGWSTWRRAWDHFDIQAKGWEVLQSDREMRACFDLDNSFDYFNMMKKQIAGEINAWDIQWYWNVFKNKGLVLFPPVSHVRNIGFDGSGSNGWLTAWLLFKSNQDWMTSQAHFPKTILVNPRDFKVIKRSLGGQGMFFLKKTKNFLMSIGK